MKKNIYSKNQSWTCLTNGPLEPLYVAATTTEEAILKVIEDTRFSSPLGRIVNCVTRQEVDGNILLLITRIGSMGTFTYPVFMVLNKEYDKVEYYNQIRLLICRYRFSNTHKLFLSDWFMFYKTVFYYNAKHRLLKSSLKILQLFFNKRKFVDLRDEEFYKKQNQKF
jgi:hypothetical protein